MLMGSAYGAKQKARRGSVKTSSVWVYAAATATTFVFVGPLLWIISLALRPESEVFRNSVLPARWDFGNFEQAMAIGSLWHYTRNSLLLGCVCTLVVLPLGFLAGYSFARYRFRGRSLLLFLFMFSLTIPGLVNLVAIYLVFSKVHLLNSYVGLSMVYAAGNVPLATWVMRSSIRAIPRELEEAAMVDGYSRFRAVLRVVVPLTWPGLVSVAVLVFVFVWQEFVIATTLISSAGKGVVSQGLFAMEGQYGTDYTVLAAGAIIISILPIMLFVILQRRFISGMTMGGVTG